MRTDYFSAEYIMLLTNIFNIFNVLCSEFADSTILTIAHRIRTVIDYDRVSLLTIFRNHKWLKYMVGDDT